MAGAIDKTTIERHYEEQLGADNEQLLEWLYLELHTARLTDVAYQWVQEKMKKLEELIDI